MKSRFSEEEHQVAIACRRQKLSFLLLCEGDIWEAVVNTIAKSPSTMSKAFKSKSNEV